MNYIIRISILLLSIIFVFIFFTCKNKINHEITNASIVFSEETHNFGIVKEGQQLDFSFQFTNKGDDTLKILNVTAKCGCTAATPDKKEFLMGESGNIKVLFNTQGRQGKQEKDIRVTTNDPKNPTKVLKIIAEIE